MLWETGVCGMRVCRMWVCGGSGRAVEILMGCGIYTFWKTVYLWREGVLML